MGLFSDGQFETCRLELEPGDRLVLYTDGIVEARDREGQMFGADRLAHLVEEWGEASADRIVEQIHAAVDDWTGGGLPRDDMTLLVLEVPGAPLTPETRDVVMHNI